MKAFILSLLAVVVISVGSAVALQQLDHSAASSNVSKNGSTRL